jgi:hypothetical protein
LFLLWTGLGIAALLCAFRGVLSRMDVAKGSMLALVLMLVVTAAVTEGAGGSRTAPTACSASRLRRSPTT